MRRNTLLVDAGIALVLAILVIVISPGLAVVGLLALLVLLVCGLSLAIGRLRKRRRENPVNELRRSRAAEARASRQRPRHDRRQNAGARRRTSRR
ncbi:MAG TPA: hypothetical protein VKR21_08285 [Solirubrobacteraceae bacterium]|nr:hypothetical protein [Solirubrobacteraceae bacterium]